MVRINFFLSALIMTLFLCCFNSCSSSSKNESEVTQQESVKVNDTLYHYEPQVYSLTGTLTQVLFYGAPGYGEDTVNDTKELVYVLELDKAIIMLADTTSDFNEAKANIEELQILTDIDLSKKINQKVTLTGTLFGAQTGHHHTEVLMDARKVVSETPTFLVDTFSIISPDIIGTYCYYARDKKEYDKDTWIFIDGNDNLGYMKLNGVMITFKLVKTDAISENKSLQQYQSADYDLKIELENTKRVGEILMRFGKMTITSKQGSSSVINFYGGCGS